MNFQQQGGNTSIDQVRHKPVPAIHPERERAYRLLEDSIAHHRSITTALIGHLFPSPTPNGVPIDMGTIAQTAFGYAAEDRSDTAAVEIMSDGDAPYFVPEDCLPERYGKTMRGFVAIERQLIKFIYNAACGNGGEIEYDERHRVISSSLEKIQIDASEFPLTMPNFMVSSIPKCDWLEFCLKLCAGHIKYGLDREISSDQRELVNNKLIAAIEARFEATPPATPTTPMTPPEIKVVPLHVKDTYVQTPPLPDRFPNSDF